MSAEHAAPIETAETPFARARAHAAKVERMLMSDAMMRERHSDLEAMLEAQGKEWARRMLEENLRLRAQLERETSVVGADGVERETTRASERHLETLLGRVPVPRLAYQAPGTTDLHPMDAALNLPRELFSHGLRRLVARQAATLGGASCPNGLISKTLTAVRPRRFRGPIAAVRGGPSPRHRDRRRRTRFPRSVRSTSPR